jgi:hypothetical protein
MKKLLGSKSAILLMGALSILFIIFLIASLGGIEFKLAKPFAYLQETQALSPGGLPTWNGFGLVIIIFAGLMIILYFLLPPDQRKKFLRACSDRYHPCLPPLKIQPGAKIATTARNPRGRPHHPCARPNRNTRTSRHPVSIHPATGLFMDCLPCGSGLFIGCCMCLGVAGMA